MSRVWKPAAVAMVTARWIRTDDHSERYAVRRLGGWRSRVGVEVQDWEVSRVRPLVVIDPDDREQVERLTSSLGWALAPSDATQLADALREFADPKPPKPAEPTGLGAVVEDANGEYWANLRDPKLDRHDRPWMNVSRPEKWREYSDVKAVSVLSEGVQS